MPKIGIRRTSLWTINAAIFGKFGVSKDRTCTANTALGPPSSPSPSTWSPPPASILKLNFDRASKGNPGTTGIGEAIRDSEGKIILLYSGFRGIETNNSA